MQTTLENPVGLGLRRRLRHWTRQGLDLVFSPECALCYAPLEIGGEALLCSGCEQQLSSEASARCARCGTRLAAPETGASCLACRKRKFRFDSVHALGDYDGAIRDAVLRMKHNGQEALSWAIGEFAWQSLGEKLVQLEPDVVAPVPMHWRRRLVRGVNSPELLAENLARRLRIPVARRLLVRRRNTLPQIDLTPTERSRNLRHAFRDSAGYHLDEANVLLVDDVLTTGATAHEAARILKRAGARRVDVFVVGRTEGLA